jgi:hypothetical protein
VSWIKNLREATCMMGDTIPALVFDLGEAETLLDEA